MDEVTDTGEFLVELIYGSVCIRPCPHCGAHSRHPSRHDPRGPIGVFKSHYYCFECGAGGKMSDLGVELTDAQITAANAHKPLPPRSSLDRFWGYCHDVSADTEAYKYLQERFQVNDLLGVKLLGIDCRLNTAKIDLIP